MLSNPQIRERHKCIHFDHQLQQLLGLKTLEQRCMSTKIGAKKNTKIIFQAKPNLCPSSPGLHSQIRLQQ